MVLITSTIASPAGFVGAIERRAALLGLDRQKLLNRAGVTQEQFDTLAAALDGANGETFRRLMNAVRLQACTFEQTTQIKEIFGGAVDGRSYGIYTQSVDGDLGE
jgi:hypothetical protein